MLLSVAAGLALPGREVANELAMNPCSGMNCAFPCDMTYCHDDFEHGGKSWEGDKCFLDRCMGCEPCKSTTPPRASLLCLEKDTWSPKFQPDNPRRACDTWASKTGSALKDTCNADTVDGRWAQEHCPFTCCLVTKGITPLLDPKGALPSPAPQPEEGEEEEEEEEEENSSASHTDAPSCFGVPCPESALPSPAPQPVESEEETQPEEGEEEKETNSSAHHVDPPVCFGIPCSDEQLAAAKVAKAAEKKEAGRGRTEPESDSEPSSSPSAATSFSSAQPATTEITIAIGFLTRGDLPLFSKVWGAFFSGCHGHAAVPIVHSQANPESDDGKAVRHALASRIEKYGGGLVPHDKTLYGDMRFSFNMVAGMFALARTASTHKAPNGRFADWIHFASERCAPVRPCPALQAFLESTPGVNHLESSPATSVGVQRIAQANVPEEFRPLVMSSQWATLWMKDVLKLVADEDRLRDKWGPLSHPAPIYGINISPRVFVYGAPDEWLWHTELAQLNATVQGPGLTNVFWSYSCQHADNNDGASPCAYLDKASTIDGCTRSQNMGDFFGRKYGNANSYITPLVHQELVEEGLLECRTRKMPKKAEPPAARQFDVEFSRLTKQYPRTRAEAQMQAGKPFWHGPGRARSDLLAQLD